MGNMTVGSNLQVNCQPRPGTVAAQGGYNPYNPYQTLNEGANRLPAVTGTRPRRNVEILAERVNDNPAMKWLGDNVMGPTFKFVGQHVARPLAEGLGLTQH